MSAGAGAASEIKFIKGKDGYFAINDYFKPYEVSKEYFEGKDRDICRIEGDSKSVTLFSLLDDDVPSKIVKVVGDKVVGVITFTPRLRQRGIYINFLCAETGSRAGIELLEILKTCIQTIKTAEVTSLYLLPATARLKEYYENRGFKIWSDPMMSWRPSEGGRRRRRQKTSKKRIRVNRTRRRR
jgi:hypothetical protein